MNTRALAQPSSWPAPGQGHRPVGRDRPAVHGEDRLHGVDQAAQRGHLLGREHDQDGQDGDAVHQRLPDPGPGDGHRDVAPRVAHLLPGGRGQLDPDEGVEEHRHHGDEGGAGRRQVADGDAVDPVAGAVEGHADGEEGEQADLPDGPAGRQPLAVAQRHHRPQRGQADEPGPEQVQGRLGQLAEEAPVDRHGHDRDRPAQPHGRARPVQQGGEGAGEAPEGHPHPDIGPALVGDGRAQLGAGQGRGDEEEDEQHHQPGEGLPAADGDGPDGVDHHHGRDEEEDGVEPAQLPAQLGPLGLPGVPRLGAPHVLDGHGRAPSAVGARSRRRAGRASRRAAASTRARGTSSARVKARRWPVKPSGRWASGSAVPRPGQRAAARATADQPVARAVTTRAPAGAARDPEGAGARVGPAQPDQGREHQQVGQGEQRDREGQGDAEVAAVVVPGHGEGGHGGGGGDQPAGQGGGHRGARPGRHPAEDGRPDAVEAGRGLGARGRHHPGEPVGDHDPEQGQGGQRRRPAPPRARRRRTPWPGRR